MDGAALWESADETEVPQLRALAAQITLRRRRQIVASTCEGVLRLCEGLAATVHTTAPQPEKARAKAAFERAQAELAPLLKGAVDEFGAHFLHEVRSTIEPQLQVGADAASRKARETAEGWHAMHWATYKATVRRNGIFRINVSRRPHCARRRRRAPPRRAAWVEGGAVKECVHMHARSG